MENTNDKSNKNTLFKKLVSFWNNIWSSKRNTFIFLLITLFIVLVVLSVYPAFYNSFLNCGTDDILEYHAYVIGFLNRIKNGQAWLYDRTLFAGTSFFASVYYFPLDIFLLIAYFFGLFMPMENAYVISMILRIVGGSLILYYYFSRKDFKPRVSYLLAIIYFVGGITQSELVFPVYVGICFYAPLAMLLVDLIIEKKGYYYLFIPFYVTTIIIYDYYIGYMLLAFLCVFFVIRYSMENKKFFLINKDFYLRLLELLGMIFIGLMIGCFILLPSLGYVMNESSRNNATMDPSLFFYTTGSGENVKISIRHYFTMWCNLFIPNSPFHLCLVSAGDYVREHATLYMTSGGLIYLSYFFFTRGKGELRLKIWVLLFNIMFGMPLFAMIFTAYLWPYTRWFFIPFLINFYAMGIAMNKNNLELGKKNFLKIFPLLLLILGFATLSFVIAVNPDYFIHYSKPVDGVYDAYFYPILVGSLIFIGIYIILLILAFIFQAFGKAKAIKIIYSMIALAIAGETIYACVIDFSNLGSTDYRTNEQIVNEKMTTLKSLTNYSYDYRTNILSDQANALVNTNVIHGMTNYGHFFQSFYNTPLDTYAADIHSDYTGGWSKSTIYGYNLLSGALFANKYVISDLDCNNYVKLPEKYYKNLGTIKNTTYYEQIDTPQFIVYDSIFDMANDTDTFLKDMALLRSAYIKYGTEPTEKSTKDDKIRYENYKQVIDSGISQTTLTAITSKISTSSDTKSISLTRFDDGQFDGNGYYTYDLSSSKYDSLFDYDAIYFYVQSTAITAKYNHHYYLCYENEDGSVSYEPMHYNLAFTDKDRRPFKLMIPTTEKTTSYVKAWGFNFNLYDEFLDTQNTYKNRSFTFDHDVMNIKFTNTDNRTKIVKLPYSYSADFIPSNDIYKTCNIDGGFLGVIVPGDVKDVDITLTYTPKYYSMGVKLTLAGTIIYMGLILGWYYVSKQKKKEQLFNNTSNELPGEQTKKDIFKEIIRFLIVGGIATLCDYAIFYLLNIFLLPKINSTVLAKNEGLNIFISTALGFGVGLLVNWFLQKFVYRYITDKQTKSKLVFLKFTILALFGLGLTELVMLLAKPTFGTVTWHIIIDFDFWKLFFKVLMTLIVLIINYIGRKLFVFKMKKEASNETSNNEETE